MEIKLYNNTSPEIAINKVKTEEIILTGYLKESTSFINPIIKVGLQRGIFTKNYCFIPDFGRYYFITDITIENNFLILSCKVDVLESFKTDILNSTQIIARQEKSFNNFLIDDKIPSYNKSFITYKKIGTTPFNPEAADLLENTNMCFSLTASNLS